MTISKDKMVEELKKVAIFKQLADFSIREDAIYITFYWDEYLSDESWALREELEMLLDGNANRYDEENNTYEYDTFKVYIRYEL